MRNAKIKYFNDIKHDKNKYINIAPINDNKKNKKMIISIKFSKM